jgi:hypothetical protein
MGNIRYRATVGDFEVFEINRAVVTNAARLVFSIALDDFLVRFIAHFSDYTLQTYSEEGPDGIARIRGMHAVKRKRP